MPGIWVGALHAFSLLIIIRTPDDGTFYFIGEKTGD